MVAGSGGNVIKEILYTPLGSVMEDTNPALRIPSASRVGCMIGI